MYHNPSRRPEYTHRMADDGSIAISSYVLSFELERFYRGWRCYWMICAARNPDELVSWGYAQTRELAEMAARNEVNKLVAGPTRCGRRAASVSQASISRG
jgi:hypothetical protein